MKNLFSIIAIAAITWIATSCSSTTAREKKAEAIEQEMALKAQQYTIDSMQQELAKQHVIDSMAEVAAVAKAAAKPKVRTETRTVYVNGNSQPVTVVQEAPPAAPQKKGWSAKAKGAAIGAGVGAITGAMVADKKGKGAIIGGAVGAGTGLGVGAIIDKKQGR